VRRARLAALRAAQAFVGGLGDAALRSVPYLSTIGAMPDAGKILVTSKEYPVVVDVLVFKKDYIEKNPKIVKATVDSFFEALDMIKREPDKAYELMGSVVKQPGDAFAKSAAYIAWQDRAANKAYYAKDHKPFVDFAVRVLKSTKVIEKEPKSEEMVDLRFQ
jgi:NitT/TauT family transport system substrate-binding protein